MLASSDSDGSDDDDDVTGATPTPAHEKHQSRHGMRDMSQGAAFCVSAVWLIYLPCHAMPMFPESRPRGVLEAQGAHMTRRNVAHVHGGRCSANAGHPSISAANQIPRSANVAGTASKQNAQAADPRAPPTNPAPAVARRPGQRYGSLISTNGDPRPAHGPAGLGRQVPKGVQRPNEMRCLLDHEVLGGVGVRPGSKACFRRLCSCSE
jgi:hypothetical protein